MNGDEPEVPDDELTSLAHRAATCDDALGKFLEAVRKWLWRIVRHFVNGDDAATEDVLQETNLVIVKNRGELKGIRSARRWCYRIAFCNAMNFHRRQRKHRMVRYTEAIADPRGDMQFQSDLHDCIERFHETLCEKLHRVAKLYLRGNYSFAEISLNTGIPVIQLKNLARRIRDKAADFECFKLLFGRDPQ